jgi:hypothetical protein
MDESYSGAENTRVGTDSSAGEAAAVIFGCYTQSQGGGGQPQPASSALNGFA